MPRAFTRAVSPRLAECQLTHLDRVPIDAAKAKKQHAEYEAALAGAGFEIVRLPELPDDPDAVFVEDTALLLDGHAILTRPGAPSRIAEVESTAAGLAADFELHRVERGHVDGGDVLRIGRRIYVGLSTRTDSEGIAALDEIARPLGFDVVEADCGVDPSRLQPVEREHATTQAKVGAAIMADADAFAGEFVEIAF